jgi:uncharacterized protein (DUF2132 family)
MFLKTNIPETTLSFAGGGVDFGDSLSDRAILADRINKLQVIPTFVFGNRCGHVPSEPRFYHRPQQHKPRPSILEQAIEGIKNLARKPKRFLKKLAFHFNDRQVRSERREAIVSVTQVLMHFLELVTLRVGFYSGLDKFIPLDLEYIAEKAGIHFLRAKRAIADLVEAGYITITRQFDKKEDGTFAGKPSIRTISIQFFIDLGIDMVKFCSTREWKRQQLENKRAKSARKKVVAMLKAGMQFGKKPLFKKIHSKRQTTLAIDESKNLINIALERHKANPERSPSEYLKELLQRLKE